MFHLLKNFYNLGSSKFFRRSSTTVTDTFKRSTASIKRKLFFNSGTFNSNGSVVHNRPLALKASEINSQDCEIAKRLSKQILRKSYQFQLQFQIYSHHHQIQIKSPKITENLGFESTLGKVKKMFVLFLFIFKFSIQNCMSLFFTIF